MSDKTIAVLTSDSAGDETIAVLSSGIVISSDPERNGRAAILTFYDDQPYGEYKTNPSRKGVSLTDKTYPELLRTVAAYMEQEGLTSVDELSAKLQAELRPVPE